MTRIGLLTVKHSSFNIHRFTRRTSFDPAGRTQFADEVQRDGGQFGVRRISLPSSGTPAFHPQLESTHNFHIHHGEEDGSNREESIFGLVQI